MRQPWLSADNSWSRVSDRMIRCHLLNRGKWADLQTSAENYESHGDSCYAENRSKFAGKIGRFLDAICICGPLRIQAHCLVPGPERKPNADLGAVHDSQGDRESSPAAIPVRPYPDLPRRRMRSTSSKCWSSLVKSEKSLTKPEEIQSCRGMIDTDEADDELTFREALLDLLDRSVCNRPLFDKARGRRIELRRRFLA